MTRGNPRTYCSYVRELKDVQLSSSKAEEKYRNLNSMQLKQQYNSLCKQLSATSNVMNDCAKQTASIEAMLNKTVTSPKVLNININDYSKRMHTDVPSMSEHQTGISFEILSTPFSSNNVISIDDYTNRMPTVVSTVPEHQPGISIEIGVFQ